jgi:hypothetical protein
MLARTPGVVIAREKPRSRRYLLWGVLAVFALLAVGDCYVMWVVLGAP